ncbi:MAG: ATP-binding cassette domain-containing protein, partial [Duncaniella sp.]|nr:ATP-binding cassette domain-containing protein [Duncaniella sp.]
MGKVIDYKDVALHRQDLIALKHVNLSVEEGEFVYLIGKVGSGKSSLLKSIYADIPIASGEARVLDYDLNTIRLRDIPYLRREIGIVFQDFQLLTDRSAYANLRFVLEATGWTDKGEIEKRIEEVLKEVGMLNKSYKNPHELSGGEQQSIVI